MDDPPDWSALLKSKKHYRKRGNIEINRRFPSADNINRIAKALNVKVSDLFADTEPESMKAMVSKKELKVKLDKVIGNASS